MLGSLGFPELIIIFVIALIIFGPRKLPELGRSLGKSLAEFKRASNELRSTLEEEIRIEEQREPQETSPKQSARPQSCRRRRPAPRAAAAHAEQPTVARTADSTPRKSSGHFMALVPFPGPQSGRCSATARRRRRRRRAADRMSFLEHLDELRKRIINCCLGTSRSASAFWSPSRSINSGSSISCSRRRAGRCRPGVKIDLHAARRSVRPLHPGRAHRGHRRRRAVHDVPGVAVHRAGPVRA